MAINSLIFKFFHSFFTKCSRINIPAKRGPGRPTTCCSALPKITNLIDMSLRLCFVSISAIETSHSCFKSHQNKFHQGTLRYLTQKFAHIREGDSVTIQDKELWEYFASLYKNSNKGIKGRGKDRRIWTVPSSNASTSSYTSNNPGNNGNLSQDDRSSRSSSYASAQEMVQYHASNHQYHGFEHPGEYGNSVFPER